MHTRMSRGTSIISRLLFISSVLFAPLLIQAQDDETSLLPYKRSYYPSTYKVLASESVAISNATILDGTGRQIDNGTLLMEDGKITAIGANIQVPEGMRIFDGTDKWVTPGIIDIHTHVGVSSRHHPSLSDGNEMTGPIQARLWVEHSLWPQHPGFARALAGGVTTMQVLPGSGNLIGGRSVIIKNVPARTMQGMKFPGAPYGLKMACGENPKRAYGGMGSTPATRMANVAGYRQAFIKAAEYKRGWENYLAKLEAGEDIQPPTQDLGMDTLAAVLDGDIFVNNHCYRADELAVMMDLAKEMGFKITAFHHTIEAYKVADLLAENDVCAVMWSDWWGYKLEALDGVLENIALVEKAGACAIAHSDSEAVMQRMNQEIAKAMAAGNRIGLDISRAEAIRWITSNPARAMRIDDKVGSLEVDKQADVVIWTTDPFSVYALAEHVFIDGAHIYDRNDPSKQPQSDYELGIVKRGDHQ